LILCLHLRPGRIDRRGGPHQPIVATRESQDEADNHNKYYPQATETENDGFVHGVIKISKHWRTATPVYVRAQPAPQLSGFASLLKQALEATENSPEGFSLDRLTLRKTPATIYPS
jgi:hypothetical protein